jgi:hypothetical protein
MLYALPTGKGIVLESDSGILNKLAKECKDPREMDGLRALYMLSICYSGCFDGVLCSRRCHIQMGTALE